MIVYRICNSIYANDLNGTGAKMYGGRWNSKGIPMLYTSSSRALAALEVLVHLPTNNVKPVDFAVVSISLPDNSIEEIDYKKLKNEIDENGLNSNFRWIGDNWIKKNTSLLLKVPSVVIKEEYNFLVNPLHKDFHKIKILSIQKFNFDSRLELK